MTSFTVEVDLSFIFMFDHTLWPLDPDDTVPDWWWRYCLHLIDTISLLWRHRPVDWKHFWVGMQKHPGTPAWRLP